MDHYTAEWPSYRAFSKGYGLTDKRMKFFWDQFLEAGTDPSDPSVSPLRAASFAGLPPTLILTAEYDVLRDEGEAYAEGLKRDGVPTCLVRCSGLNHGFLRWIGVIPEVDAAMRNSIKWLREQLRESTIT